MLIDPICCSARGHVYAAAEEKIITKIYRLTIGNCIEKILLNLSNSIVVICIYEYRKISRTVNEAVWNTYVVADASSPEIYCYHRLQNRRNRVIC